MGSFKSVFRSKGLMNEGSLTEGLSLMGMSYRRAWLLAVGSPWSQRDHRGALLNVPGSQYIDP